MGYLRKECSTCGYWKKIGQHCGAIMHGMKCIAGPLTVEPGAAVPLPEGEKPDGQYARNLGIELSRVVTANAVSPEGVAVSALYGPRPAYTATEAEVDKVAYFGPTPGSADVKWTKAKDTQVAGDHYKKMGVEPWDVVDTWPLEQRIGAYRHGALKYLMRMGSKDQSAQEIAKGKHYMEKLLEVLNDA